MLTSVIHQITNANIVIQDNKSFPDAVLKGVIAITKSKKLDRQSKVRIMGLKIDLISLRLEELKVKSHTGTIANIDHDYKFDYNEWNPPAPSTVYCKMNGITYNLYKYYRTRSSGEIQIKSIEDKLNSHKYNCACCSSYLDGACSHKNKVVSKDAICKSFEP